MAHQQYSKHSDVQLMDSPRAHRSSRASIRNLFTRSKSVVGDRTSSMTPFGSLSEELPQSSARPAYHRSLSSTRSVSNRSRATTSSGINLKHSSPPAQRRSKTRELTSWDPPPLFQAYPQSVICTTLDGSLGAADSIHFPRTKSSMAELPDGDLDEDPVLVGRDGRRRNSSPKTHRRDLSSSISHNGSVRKLFILVTSGHLLQYAAEGHHDRLPEKILTLGKYSVAFASDAIPGKHWVLHVAQEAGEEGWAKTKPGKSSWGKFQFRSAESRRMAKEILLVFDSPDEFDFWMGAVRKEIEGLGSLQYRSTSPTDEVSDATLEPKVSQRFLLPTDSYQFSSEPRGRYKQHLSPFESEPFSYYDSKIDEKAPEVSLIHVTPTLSLEGSSIFSSAELEGLRSSDSSSISATTAPRTSFEEYSNPVAYTTEKRSRSNRVSGASSKARQPSTRRSSKSVGSPKLKRSPTPPSHVPDRVERNRSIDFHVPRSQAVQNFLAAQAQRERPESWMPNFSLPMAANRISQETNASVVHIEIPSEGQPESEPTSLVPEQSCPEEPDHERQVLDQQSSEEQHSEEKSPAQEPLGQPLSEKPSFEEQFFEAKSEISTPPSPAPAAVEKRQPYNQRPVSTITPLPKIGVPKSIRLSHRSMDSTRTVQATTVAESDICHCRPSPPQSFVSRRRAVSASSNYGLFPRRYSSIENPQSLLPAPSPPPQRELPENPQIVPPTRPLTPIPRLSSSSRIVQPAPPPRTSSSRHLRPRASLQIHTGRLTQSIVKPQRSPSVTDAHFATCFGTQAEPEPELDSRQTSPNLSLSDLSIFTPSSVSIPSPVFPPPRRRTASPRKSASALALRVPAAGPPPSCPLPAVPVAAKRLSKGSHGLEPRLAAKRRSQSVSR